MSAKDFKFVSPGVFIEEIDNSQLPKTPVAIGPLVIGRTRRGPAYQPVRVDSFSEFVQIFGNPVGGEEASDVWRSGIPTAPTFAAYAAQAWLKNSSPLTFIRLLGDQSPDAATSDAAKAGWKSSDIVSDAGGGAYGLFLFNSSSDAAEAVDGTLAAILYTTEGGFALSGAVRGTGTSDAHVPDLTHATASAALIQSTSGGDFTLQVYDKNRTLSEEAVINFSRGSQNYVRKILNTNPTLTNTQLVDTTSAAQKKFWLGQTFERQVRDTITNYANSTVCYGALLRLGRTGTDVANAGDYKFATRHARSGWFFSQDLRNTPADASDIGNNTFAPNIYDPASLSGVTRLFKIHSVSAGEDEHRQYKISIEDLQYSKNDNTPYGSFTLAIRDAKDSDNSKVYVERYTNLSLDPSSPNYISKQIGDRYYEWDTNQRRLIEYGSYENRSSIIRVEVANAVDSGQTDPEMLPFGVEGPIRMNDFAVVTSDDAGTVAATATVLLNDSTKIRTGVGAVISQGENSANGGIFAKNTTISGLAGNTIQIVLTDVGLTDSNGAALSGTYEIVFKSEVDVSGLVAGANQVLVSCGDGTGTVDGDDDTTLAILAERIVQCFKRDTSYALTGFSGTYSQLFKFDSGWDKLAAATAGGDLDSVFEASVVNTSGVKLQARGYNGGTHEWGNDGRYGGDTLVDDSDWKVNCPANFAHTSGDQTTITAGTNVGATSITTTCGAGTQVVTANKKESDATQFLVGHSKAQTLTNLIAALNAELNQSAAASSVADTLIITNTGDSGEAGNARTIQLAGTTSGALTVQGVADDSTQNFTGGDEDGDMTNAFVQKTATDPAAPESPVTAGSGSTACFMAPTGAAGTTVEIQAQFAGRAEGNIPFTGSVAFPTVPLRLSASDGDLSDPTEAYFGAQYNRSVNDSTYEDSMIDVLYPMAVATGGYSPSSNASGGLITSWYFSLDDLMMKETANQDTTPVIYYDSGSRARGDSISARSGSYKNVLDKGYDRFSAPMYGGFNGFDITEQEPFNDSRALVANASETSYSMFYSAKKAIDMFADPEFIESNILALPGIVNQGLTTHMIETCESRGDAMALIDPRGGYKPASENADTEQLRITSGAGLAGVSRHVKEVADNMQERNLNSSYGATYYPWVRITDTITGRNLWAPPSIAAFGAMSFSENEAALWFAPAGFNRGGLTDGAAGIPVTNVRNRLTSKERDYLYERNINPIASFPNEGIVIFGQKTLQVTPSALDRINVRRLMIFVKKEISRIASNLLFDQNVEQTWARFTGAVNPFLDNIRNNFGLDDFRVVLDETTTTPDLIDRNTIYAKIFLKPTKAVEFFAIDFVITNSGASFED